MNMNISQAIFISISMNLSFSQAIHIAGTGKEKNPDLYVLTKFIPYEHEYSLSYLWAIFISTPTDFIFTWAIHMSGTEKEKNSRLIYAKIIPI